MGYHYRNIICLVTLVHLVACTSRKEPVVAPVGTQDSCSTNISYSKHIQPILQKNCALSGCHIPRAQPYDLTVYAGGVKSAVDNGHLKERIDGSNPSFPIMPPSGGLTTCEKSKITAWINAGAPDN